MTEQESLLDASLPIERQATEDERAESRERKREEIRAERRRGQRDGQRGQGHGQRESSSDLLFREVGSGLLSSTEGDGSGAVPSGSVPAVTNAVSQSIAAQANEDRRDSRDQRGSRDLGHSSNRFSNERELTSDDNLRYRPERRIEPHQDYVQSLSSARSMVSSILRQLSEEPDEPGNNRQGRYRAIDNALASAEGMRFPPTILDGEKYLQSALDDLNQLWNDGNGPLNLQIKEKIEKALRALRRIG